MHTCNIL